jgi:hypothetical protein
MQICGLVDYEADKNIPSGHGYYPPVLASAEWEAVHIKRRSGNLNSWGLLAEL